MAKRSIRSTSVAIVALSILLMIALVPCAFAESSTPPSAEAAGVSTPLVTLELRATDVRDVLQMLARLGEVNIVADETVKGEVTISLTEVPFWEAVDYVTRVAGYAYKRVNGTIMVSTAERLSDPIPEAVVTTEIIALRNANPNEIKTALAVVMPDSRISAEPRTKSVVLRGTAEEIAAAKSIVAKLDVALPSNVEPETTAIIPVRFSDPEEIKRTLVLTIDEKRVLTHKQSRSLIVRGTKAQLDQVKALVDGLDKPDGTPVAASEPQTTEVFALKYADPEEVKSALAAVLPVDNVRLEKRTGSLIITGTKNELVAARALLERLDQGVAQIYLEARLEEISDDGLQELGLEWPTEWEVSQEGSGPLTSVVVTDWTANLKTLEQSGKANLLANPKILAVDGQEANIHIGDSIPVEVIEIQDGQKVNKIQFIEAGIILKVTPKINGAGVITTKIVPEVSTITGWAPNGYPQIRKRQAETVLRMTDGQTAAIGGLRMEQEVTRKEGLPYLGRIPLLGKLFAVDKVEKKTSELVIFITAKVVKEGQDSPLMPLLSQTAKTQK